MDDGPSDHDNVLLARLNALKKSNVSLESTNFLITPPTPTDTAHDLTSRFRTLSGILENNPNKGGADIHLVEADDTPPSPTIEELLAELGPEDQYTLSTGEVYQAKKLLAEAKRALPAEDQGRNDFEEGKGSVPLVEISTEEQDAPKTEENKEFGEDDAEPDAFLQQILDEVELEKERGGKQNDHSSSASNVEDPRSLDTTSDPDNGAPSFPSLPTHDLPPLSTSLSSSPPKTLFPSAPTSAPSAKKPNSTQKKPQKFSEAEIDSWCIICCGDAKVRCQGCAGDLYCWSCWKEGHTGPDAGFEEKRHRWVGLGKVDGHGEGI